VSTDLISLPNQQELNWPTTLAMVALHLGAIAALFMFSWPILAATVFLYWMTTGLGISMGYHRLHTHRGFKTYQQNGIVLTANQRLDLGNLILQLGAVSETVTVQAEAAGVQTDSSEQSAVLTSNQLSNLTTRGRDVVS